MSGKFKKKVDIKNIISGFLKRCDEEGNTLLHYVAQTNNVEFAKQLIAAGCDVTLKNNNGYSPLICAISKGQVEMVEILLSSGAFYDDRDSYGLLHYAASYGWPDIVKLLIKHGADVNARNKRNGDTPLHAANNHLRKIKSDDYCLIVQTLVDSGAEFDVKNAYDETPLEKAVESGCSQVFELMLDLGANIYTNEKEINHSLIHSAVRSDNLIVLERLIGLGHNVNSTDKRGNSCLHYAAVCANPKSMEYLLEKGAATNIINKSGFDPIWKAIGHWYSIISEIDDDDEVEVKNIKNKMKCIELLIDYGADVNYSMHNSTPLYTFLYYFQCGRSFAKILLKNGASVDFDHPTVGSIIDNPKRPGFPHILLRHVAIFQAQNRTDGPTNFNLTKLKRESQKDYARCRDELELMKTTKIDDTNVSFFHILVNPDIGPYTRNQSITNAFETLDISKRFPIYSDLLTERFFKEVEFHRLVSKAKENLAYILQWDQSSEYIVLGIIVNYLDKKSLKNLSLISDKL